MVLRESVAGWGGQLGNCNSTKQLTHKTSTKAEGVYLGGRGEKLPSVNSGQLNVSFTSSTANPLFPTAS